MKEYKTSVKIDRDTWMRAKIFAIRSPMTVSEYLRLALVEYMERHPLPEEKTDKPNSQS